MPIEIKINDSLDPKARYITLCPVALPDPADAGGGGADSQTLEQSRQERRRTGGVLRQSDRWRATDRRRLTLTLPADGTWVDFGLGGRPGQAERRRSRLPAVASLRRREPDGAADGARPEERQQAQSPRARPISAGAGQAQHAARSDAQRLPDAAQHARAGRRSPRNTSGPQFLPWHRIVSARPRASAPGDRSVGVDALLALRRTGAEGVYQARSWAKRSGRPTTASLVSLDPANPLVAWVTDSVPGILRSTTLQHADAAGARRTGLRVAQPGPDVGARDELSPLPCHGGHTPRRRTRLVQRLDLGHPDRAEGSAVLHAALQRRSPLGAVAVDEPHGPIPPTPTPTPDRIAMAGA